MPRLQPAQFQFAINFHHLPKNIACLAHHLLRLRCQRLVTTNFIANFARSHALLHILWRTNALRQHRHRPCDSLHLFFLLLSICIFFFIKRPISLMPPFECHHLNRFDRQRYTWELKCEWALLNCKCLLQLEVFVRPGEHIKMVRVVLKVFHFELFSCFAIVFMKKEAIFRVL